MANGLLFGHFDSEGKVEYLQLWVLGGKVAILFVFWTSLPGFKQNQYNKFLLADLYMAHIMGCLNPFLCDANQSFSSENLTT